MDGEDPELFARLGSDIAKLPRLPDESDEAYAARSEEELHRMQNLKEMEANNAMHGKGSDDEVEESPAVSELADVGEGAILNMPVLHTMHPAETKKKRALRRRMPKVQIQVDDATTNTRITNKSFKRVYGDRFCFWGAFVRV